MNLTESEAKKKECQFRTMSYTLTALLTVYACAQEKDSTEGNLSVFKKLDDMKNCIASKCMMWQTTDYTANNMEGHCGLIRDEAL